MVPRCGSYNAPFSPISHPVGVSRIKLTAPQHLTSGLFGTFDSPAEFNGYLTIHRTAKGRSYAGPFGGRSHRWGTSPRNIEMRKRREEDVMGKALQLLNKLAKDEEGAALVEYTVLLGIMLVAVVGTIGLVGGWVNTKWTALWTALSAN
jgi:pilus assembly protein Flp/PilA